MDMSPACAPARYGRASPQDQKHPLFTTYQQYRSGMSRLMVDSVDFRDWLYGYEQEIVMVDATKNTQFPAFMKWMAANKGGARRCPAGDFPHNMYFWIEGGRW